MQLPILLNEASEPEPDVSVVSGPLGDADVALPSGALLIVVFRDTNLALDRTAKASLYARAGIADYWFLNLVERVLEVHREPTPDRRPRTAGATAWSTASPPAMSSHRWPRPDPESPSPA